MPEPTTPRRRIVGVSTKMYFSATRTACFVTSVIDLLAAPLTTSSKRPALDEIDVFIVPDHVTLVGVIDQVRSAPAGTPASRIIVGAQDCSDKDFGAFTGEVSPAVLAEVGCGIVELGHAERRRLFGETDASAASKAAAVVRNRMVPLVCVGELGRGGGVEGALGEVMAQVRSVLAQIPDQEEVVLAYEPVWAIGAAEPAGTGHVCEVVDGIRRSEEVRRKKGVVRILYGGSAGPGLFEKLKGSVDGLFLGRFAHDPGQFYRTVCEVANSEPVRRQEAN